MFPIINSKHISSFSTSSAETSKQGYLLKKGDNHKVFKKRWFALKGNILFYFEHKDAKDPIGLIILECCCIDVSLEQNLCDRFLFTLQFKGGDTMQRYSDRAYTLAADSQLDMENWMYRMTMASQMYARKIIEVYSKRLNFLENQNKEEEHKPYTSKHRHNPFHEFNATDSKKQSHFHKLHQQIGLQIEPWLDMFATLNAGME